MKDVKEPLKILELGAGYGRTANVILSLKPNTKYVIADLAPSVYFSKKTLMIHLKSKKLNPDLK